MKKISIRLRLALWYGILTSILMLVFLPVFYQILCSNMYDDLKNNLKLNAQSIADDLNLFEGDIANYKIPSNVKAAIINKDGDVLLSNCNLSWMKQTPFYEKGLWEKKVAGHEWMIYDQKIKVAEYSEITVRVFNTQDDTINSIRHVFYMVILGGILFIVFSFLGGLIIAKKALAPIKKMIDTANEIKSGNISKRIQGINTKDEVGNLAETFNSMLEHLEDAMTREKRFASDASHELRTPIAIIMNSMESLISDASLKGDSIPDEYDIIFDESKKMKQIISQLSMLSRGDANKYDIQFEKFELVEMICNIVDQKTEIYGLSESIIDIKCPEKIYFYGDQTLITQMMINLLDNAIKYSEPETRIKIYINVTANDELKICVIDHGIGIEKDVLPHIFKRFYRADKVRDRNGSGLGLSLVKWIVEVHHGEIKVISEIGKGSCFEIIFPLKRTN